jgi:hypothetical protein
LPKDNKIAANEVIPNYFQTPIILSQISSNKSTSVTPRENENNGDDKNGRHNQ